MQNIVGLDDGLAPDQRQAIIQLNCMIYAFPVMNILSYPSELGYSDYYEFLMILFLCSVLFFVRLFLYFVKYIPYACA